VGLFCFPVLGDRALSDAVQPQLPSSDSGLTLPVWAAAASRAALQCLRGDQVDRPQWLQLDPQGPRQAVAIEAVAPLAGGWALAMARCDPGPGVLDLTRDLLIWAQVRWLEGDGPWLSLMAGEGVGRALGSAAPCLSGYARELLAATVRPLVPPGRCLELQIQIPEGRRLAARTSNAAFGVVEGLALIGTQARVQRSAAPEQLDAALQDLASRVAAPGGCPDLVLVIGENGLDLAPRLGLPPGLLLKAGNWLGPLLVAAAEAGVGRLLLFGYQGKLIKLAGGIFHTHHHLADGRAEVLTALAALEGLTGEPLSRLYAADTVDQAFQALDQEHAELSERLRRRLAATIEQRSQAYLARHGQHQGMEVGALLFDRSRRLCALGPCGAALLGSLQQESAGAGLVVDDI
jgi:cobalt-precorrin-5B (C1)-methyltransferase